MLVGLAIFTPEQIVVLRQGFDLGVPDDETLGSGELGFTRHTINVLSDKLRDAYTDHPQLALDLTPDEAFALEGCFTVGAEMAEQVPTEKLPRGTRGSARSQSVMWFYILAPIGAVGVFCFGAWVGFCFFLSGLDRPKNAGTYLEP